MTEHIGNQTVPGIPVKNFDAALYAMPEEKVAQMVPELLITYGGHVVSKRLKKFLRQHPPKEHWHVSPDGEVVDLYGSLTTVIENGPVRVSGEDSQFAGQSDSRISPCVGKLL